MSKAGEINLKLVIQSKLQKLVPYLLGIGDFSPVKINFLIKSYKFSNGAI